MRKINLYNKERKLVRTIEFGEEIREEEYRNSAHIWLINENNEFAVFKRTLNEKKFKGWWTVASAGEEGEGGIKKSIVDRMKSKAGIKLQEEGLNWLLSYNMVGTFVDVFVYHCDFSLSQFVLNEKDFTDVKYASIEEIEKLCEQKEFIFQPYFQFLKRYLGECPIADSVNKVN